MKEFWSSRIRGLTPYTPGEQPRERKFIKLNTNENPIPPPMALSPPSARRRTSRCGSIPTRIVPSCGEVMAATCGLKPSQVFVGNGSTRCWPPAFRPLTRTGSFSFPT